MFRSQQVAYLYRRVPGSNSDTSRPEAFQYIGRAIQTIVEFLKAHNITDSESWRRWGPCTGSGRFAPAAEPEARIDRRAGRCPAARREAAEMAGRPAGPGRSLAGWGVRPRGHRAQPQSCAPLVLHHCYTVGRVSMDLIRVIRDRLGRHLRPASSTALSTSRHASLHSARSDDRCPTAALPAAGPVRRRPRIVRRRDRAGR